MEFKERRLDSLLDSEVTALYLRLQGNTQQNIAATMQASKPAVSRMLSRASNILTSDDPIRVRKYNTSKLTKEQLELREYRISEIKRILSENDIDPKTWKVNKTKKSKINKSNINKTESLVNKTQDIEAEQIVDKETHEKPKQKQVEYLPKFDLILTVDQVEKVIAYFSYKELRILYHKLLGDSNVDIAEVIGMPVTEVSIKAKAIQEIFADQSKITSRRKTIISSLPPSEEAKRQKIITEIKSTIGTDCGLNIGLIHRRRSRNKNKHEELIVSLKDEKTNSENISRDEVNINREAESNTDNTHEKFKYTINTKPRKVAVYAGNFDIFTFKQLDVIKKAARILDELIILIDSNYEGIFTPSKREKIISDCISKLGFNNIKVITSNQFEARFAADNGINRIIIETTPFTNMSEIYKRMNTYLGINRQFEFIMIPVHPEYSFIDEDEVLKLARSKERISNYVRTEVENAIAERLNNQ